jgi:hypothetical protein
MWMTTPEAVVPAVRPESRQLIYSDFGEESKSNGIHHAAPMREVKHCGPVSSQFGLLRVRTTQ